MNAHREIHLRDKTGNKSITIPHLLKTSCSEYQGSQKAKLTSCPTNKSTKLKSSNSWPMSQVDKAKYSILKKEREAQKEMENRRNEKERLQKEYRNRIECDSSNNYPNIFAQIIQLDDQELINICHVERIDDSLKNKTYMGHRDLQISFPKKERMNRFHHQGHRRYSSYSRERQNEALKQISCDGKIVSLYWREGI